MFQAKIAPSPRLNILQVSDRPPRRRSAPPLPLPQTVGGLTWLQTHARRTTNPAQNGRCHVRLTPKVENDTLAARQSIGEKTIGGALPQSHVLCNETPSLCVCVVLVCVLLHDIHSRSSETVQPLLHMLGESPFGNPQNKSFLNQYLGRDSFMFQTRLKLASFISLPIWLFSQSRFGLSPTGTSCCLATVLWWI